jgi:hypothetical protein
MDITLWMMEDGVWRDAGCAVIIEVPDDMRTLHVKLISVLPVREDLVFECESSPGHYYPWSEIPLVSGSCAS